jgi:DNA-binding NarL/FixJ family response regulator
MEFSRIIYAPMQEHLHNALFNNPNHEISSVEEIIKHFNYLGQSNQNLPFAPVYYIRDIVNGRYLVMTDQIYNLVGYKAQEFLDNGSEKMESLIYPEYLKILKEKIHPYTASFLSSIVAEECSSYIFTTNYHCKTAFEGTAVALDHSIYMASEINGELLYALGCILDVSRINTDKSIVHSVNRSTLKGIIPIECKYYYPYNELCILSKRELEVLFLIADGLSRKQIAPKLNISENTIDVHIQNIMRKTNTKNAAQMVAQAVRNRLI